MQFFGELRLKYWGSSVNLNVWLGPARVKLLEVIKQKWKSVNMFWLTTKLSDIYDSEVCMLTKI